MVAGGMRLALGARGYLVRDVPDYFEALAEINDFRPDLVILDEARCLVDACQACSELYRLLRVPVILVGYHFSGEAWARAVAAGADFYLTPPYSYRELTARVKAILRRY